MPSFNSQCQSTRGISWSGIIGTLLVQILVLLALGFAVVRYLKWSSDVNQAEFMSARPSHRRLIRIIPALPRCTTGIIFPYFSGRCALSRVM
jgi:hypothetical protein